MMVRDQMLCIVTPDAPLVVPTSITRRLDMALCAAGCVHFATLALLPPEPDSARSGSPSMLFEVIVDEDIKPQEAVDALVRAGFAVLWRLYGRAWTGSVKAGVDARRTWLRAYLNAHMEAADCGFIGARDRNVAQILAEHELLQGACKQLSHMPRGQDVGREELADHIMCWAARNRFNGTGEPARRSIWRRGGLPTGLRLPLLALRLGVPAVTAVSVLGWLGLAVAWLPTVLARHIIGIDITRLMASDVGIPLLVVLALLTILGLVLLVVGARSIEAVLVMLLFTSFTLLTGVTAVIFIFWLQEWWVVWCGAQLVLVGIFALLAAMAGLAALMPLVALISVRIPPWFPAVAALTISALFGVISFLISYLAQGQLSSLDCENLRWPQRSSITLPTRLFWILVTTIAMAAFVYMSLRLLPSMNRLASGWLRRLDRPREIASTPLHQVHPSIDDSEAALVGRQSHMISLSEIRAPTWWHGARLRFCLWLISQFAEVFFTAGRLGSADGIKFGHWRILGNGRRLLFCSNFDGAFGGYLDEFIHGASQGVNLIWGCTELRPRAPARSDQPAVLQARCFPKVSLLIFQGCKHEQAFKAYARASMLPHLYRFEAYTLSMQDIERATRLRDALCMPRSALKVDQILRAIES
jgi:hypothetical protein